MENSSYNEEVDEFAPAKPDAIPAPVQPNLTAVEPPTDVVEPPNTPNEPNAYESIISQQTEQINALIAQNQSLTNQITQLIQNGAQIMGNSQPGRIDPLSNLNGAALSDDDDWSLEALAKDIGKRERR